MMNRKNNRECKTCVKIVKKCNELLTKHLNEVHVQTKQVDNREQPAVPPVTEVQSTPNQTEAVMEQAGPTPPLPTPVPVSPDLPVENPPQ